MAKMIRIVSKKDGFRRAGIDHTGSQTYPPDRFSKAQLAQLKAEPMLVVDEVEAPDEPAPPKPGKPGKEPPAA